MTTVLDPAAIQAIKGRQQKTWASGDYSAVAATIHPMAELLAQAADLPAGARVLDVACGSGNAALAAARCGCRVTAIDYVPELLERAKARSAAEGLPIELDQGDAEALPYPDGAFDAVLSVVGVMFAPDQERAAAELVRVCRPEGRVALAAWTPDGFIGELFRTVGRHVPPPAGLRSPVQWGSEARLQELLCRSVSALTSTQREFVFRFTDPEDFVEFFRVNYGPTVTAFAGLGDDGRAALHADLVELARRHDSSTNGTLRIRAAYLETLATR